MADVRALLAAERQSRRISHPHLTYSKNGALNCNICNLNIKSEQLWPGHLKSLNHRKNVQKMSSEPVRPQKRKIESVDVNEEEERNYEVDSRKKPKPASPPEKEAVQPVPYEEMESESTLIEPPMPPVLVDHGAAQPEEQGAIPPKPSENVDEDEWAAFEREVAPLKNQDYTAAVIEAAPVSAAEISVQQKTNTLQQREEEAEAEKEDESRRMEEEFEVMEEMEDRVKRLRARREALRSQAPPSNAQPAPSIGKRQKDNLTDREQNTRNEASSDEDDNDGWYD